MNNADAARLSVLLGVPSLRDAAWESITPQDLNEHHALWADMTRRSVVNTVGCASLLAFTCWLTGNASSPAWLERALEPQRGLDRIHLLAAQQRRSDSHRAATRPAMSSPPPRR